MCVVVVVIEGEMEGKYDEEFLGFMIIIVELFLEQFFCVLEDMLFCFCLEYYFDEVFIFDMVFELVDEWDFMVGVDY